MSLASYATQLNDRVDLVALNESESDVDPLSPRTTKHGTLHYVQLNLLAHNINAQKYNFSQIMYIW